MSDAPNRPLILFDGVCNLCNSAVNFIIDRDPRAELTFAPLQSPAGKMMLARFGLADDALDSIVLVENSKCFTRSAAALRIARHLKGLWPILYVFILIPRPLRDLIYDWIARNRYRWFGRRDACRLPGPEIADRFVDGDVVVK